MRYKFSVFFSFVSEVKSNKKRLKLLCKNFISILFYLKYSSKLCVLNYLSKNIKRIKMEQLNPSDLKAILHSKRANVYYLEHARVMQKDGRVLYLTEAKNENQYWNIPIANTTVILLGTGTSIT